MKIFKIFIFCLLFFSCAKREEKIPDDIIPKEKMVQVLVDIHIAEAQSQMKGGYDDSKIIKSSYYKFIFEKYKINYRYQSIFQ